MSRCVVLVLFRTEQVIRLNKKRWECVKKRKLAYILSMADANNVNVGWKEAKGGRGGGTIKTNRAPPSKHAGLDRPVDQDK